MCIPNNGTTYRINATDSNQIIVTNLNRSSLLDLYLLSMVMEENRIRIRVSVDLETTEVVILGVDLGMASATVEERWQ